MKKYDDKLEIIKAYQAEIFTIRELSNLWGISVNTAGEQCKNLERNHGLKSLCLKSQIASNTHRKAKLYKKADLIAAFENFMESKATKKEAQKVVLPKIIITNLAREHSRWVDSTNSFAESRRSAIESELLEHFKNYARDIRKKRIKTKEK